jgi:hypothetical protein
MHSFLNNLFRSDRPVKPATSRRPPRARLEVEGLEQRWTPSTSSIDIHAVTDRTGGTVAFFTANGTLHEKTDQGTVQDLGMPSNYIQMSAGLDYNGNAEVYLLTGGNALTTITYRSDADGVWHTTPTFPSGPGNVGPTGSNYITSFAAVKGGRLYAGGFDGSVWQFQTPYTTTGFISLPGRPPIPVTIYHGGTWSEIRPQFSLYSLDAVTDVTGHDNLFGYGGGAGAIGWFVPGVSSQVTAINGGFNWSEGIGQYSYTFSAGLDTNGLADLFIKTVDGNMGTNLFKWTSTKPNAVTPISVPGFGYNDGISATTGGMCFFTVLIPGNANNSIGDYDPNSGVLIFASQPFAGTDVKQLSAAQANDAFVIGANSIVQEVGLALSFTHRDYGFFGYTIG